MSRPLPFDLSAAELKRRGDEILRTAEAQLADIEHGPIDRTVSNTLEPINRLLVGVHDVGNHGRFVFVTHPDAACRHAGRLVGEAADRFFNAFRVREASYRVLTAVDPGTLDADGRHALDKLLLEMRRAGVELDPPGREQVRSLNDEIDRLSNQFDENINRLARTVVVDDPRELEGLPPDYVAAHSAGADGHIRLSTQYPDAFPVLRYAESSELRRRMLVEFMNRAYPENIPVLKEILERRYELARRLGYRNFAEYIIEDKMMASTKDGWEFLARLSTLLTEPAAGYRERLLRRKRKDQPGAARLDAWDGGGWFGRYYDTKLRDEDFGVDAKVLRQYLPYVSVRDGLLALCERLFELRFARLPDAERWHPSVEVFEVAHRGEPLGRFYLDLIPREGKYSHAAQFNLIVGISGLQLPEAALVCNFLDPGTPVDSALMEYSDVVTFFHEFGHLLHALFSGHGRWLYNTQSFVEWDFVEAPSQLFEEWAKDPATLGRFAKRLDTGEPIPSELLDRLEASESLGRANAWLFQVGWSSASLAFYDRDPEGIDPTTVLREAVARVHPLAPPTDTHPEAGWGHLTGYSALYYTYAWSNVIARDLLGRFLERGSLTDPVLASRYAETILKPGSRKHARELVRDFLGREFGFSAFERWVLTDPYAAHPQAPPPRQG